MPQAQRVQELQVLLDQQDLLVPLVLLEQRDQQVLLVQQEQQVLLAPQVPQAQQDRLLLLLIHILQQHPKLHLAVLTITH